MKSKYYKEIFTAIALTHIAPAFSQMTGDEQVPSETRQLQTVVVSARRSIEQRFFASGSLIVVDRTDIERLGADSVGDVLRQLPGVQVTPSATGGVEIRMRGMDSSATQLLIDGQRVSSGKSQLPIDQLPAELIERIEVLRAPSAQYSGASGGTLNIVLRQANAKAETSIRLSDLILWQRNAGQLFLSNTGPLNSPIENLGYQRALKAMKPAQKLDATKKIAKGAVKTSANDDADDANAIVANKLKPEVSPQVWSYFVALANTGQLWGADVHRTTAVSDGSASSVTDGLSRFRRSEFTLVPRINGKLSATDQVALRGTFSRSHLNGATESQTNGLNASNAYNSSTDEYQDRKKDYTQASIDWTHRFKTSMLETTLNGSRATEVVNRAGDIFLNANTKAQASAYSFVDDRTERNWSLGTKLTGTSSPLLWSVGIDTDTRNLYVDNITNTSSSTTAAPVNLHLNAKIARHTIWAQNEWELPATTTLTAGLRAEKTVIQSIDTDNLANQNRFFLQPSLHSRTSISEDMQIRVNLARIAKNPSIWDLIDRTIPSPGINTINSPDFTGNPNLQPEKAWTLDFGFERRLPTQGQMGLNVFVRNLTDAIGTSTVLIDNRWTEQRNNVGNARVWGLEADVKTGLTWLGMGSDWSLSANASLLQSKLTSGENQGSRIPGQARYLANVNIAKPLRRSGGWYGGTSLSLTGPAQLNTSPLITGQDRARLLLDIYVGSVLPNLGYWRLGFYNIGNAKFNRDRNYLNSNGTVLADNASMQIGRRIFLSFGTQF